jgi:hypothetical protein
MLVSKLRSLGGRCHGFWEMHIWVAFCFYSGVCIDGVGYEVCGVFFVHADADVVSLAMAFL